MARKKTPNRNRVLDDRLWDDQGREWNLADDELTRPAIAELLSDRDVRCGIHTGRSRLEWVEPEDRLRAWKSTVEPNFHDVPGWQPPAGAPGQLPFHGTLWRSGTDRLVIFDDFD